MYSRYKLWCRLGARRWYQYVLLLVLKLLFDYGENLLFENIPHSLKNVAELLYSHRMLLSWVVIPGIIVALIIKDYIKSGEKQLPSGLCKEFQNCVRQLTNCICDIIDYDYSIDPEVGEKPKHPEHSGKQLTEKFNAILDKLDALSGGRNIPRFRIEIKDLGPFGRIATGYYKKLETFDSVLDWIEYWRKPFINNPDSPVDTKSNIKDEILDIVNKQEKTYLDKYRDKLTVSS